MSFVLAWVAFPLVGVLLALGWGLGAELATGSPLHGALLAPLGLAAIVVVTQLLTAFDATAELAAPVVAVGGAAGLAVRRERIRTARLDGWLAGAAAAVFLVYAAPIVLSGSATFAGYGQLGDIADHFIIVDSMMKTGGLAPHPTTSAYEMAIFAYPVQGYPTGMHTALGALRPLVGQDVAWVFQPYLALVMALAALALAPLVEPVLATRRARAVAIAAAAVPALTYGYALQGAIKELGTIWLLALLGGLLPWYAAAPPGPRRVIPVVLASAAAIGVVGVAIAPWLGPIMLAYVWIAARGRPRAAALEAAAFALATAVLALPTFTHLGIYTNVVAGVATRQSELGNLIRPLSVWQLLPGWPSADFRFEPGTTAGWLAVAVTGVAAALGAAVVLRRTERHWALVAWLVAGAIGWAYATRKGSPWVDAKGLAIVAPAVALTAAIGALSLLERGPRAAGAIVGLLLGGAVLWSIGAQVRGASLAPRDRLDELASLEPRLRGPTLYPQFEPFAKYFLRDGAPDSLTEPYPGLHTGPLWRPGVTGRPLGSSYDLDELAGAYISHFRTIVLRRGPGSRPPAIYRRVWRGHYYELWERSPGAQARWEGVVTAGTVPSAVGRPDCAAIRELVRVVRRTGARIVAHVRPPPVVWRPADAPSVPSGWGRDHADPLTLIAPGPGAVHGAVRLAAGGEYAVWLGSSLGAEVTVSIDGREVGRVRNGIQPRGQFLPFGTVRLRAGRHTVEVRRGGAGLRPGAEGGSRFIGALVLDPARAADAPLLTVAPDQATTLCRRTVDWVDSVRP